MKRAPTLQLCLLPAQAHRSEAVHKKVFGKREDKVYEVLLEAGELLFGLY